MQGISKICSLYITNFCYIAFVYYIFCYSWPWGEEYLSNLLCSSTVLWKIQPTVYKDREHVSGGFTSLPPSALASGTAKNLSGSRDNFLSHKRFCSNTRGVTNYSAIRFYRNLRWPTRRYLTHSASGLVSSGTAIHLENGCNVSWDSHSQYTTSPRTKTVSPRPLTWNLCACG